MTIRYYTPGVGVTSIECLVVAQCTDRLVRVTS